MLFFSSAPVRPDSVDSDQYEQLQAFRASCMERGLVETYADVGEFARKLPSVLQLMANQHELFAASRAEDRAVQPEHHDLGLPGLSDEAEMLLKEASKGERGIIMRYPALGGAQISANEKQFVDLNDPRSRATWVGALEELEAQGLVERTSETISHMTRAGYHVADSLE